MVWPSGGGGGGGGVEAEAAGLRIASYIAEAIQKAVPCLCNFPQKGIRSFGQGVMVVREEQRKGY